MKDLRQPKYFLGIDVAYSKQDIFISHKKYVLDHLQKIEKLECKSISVLTEKNNRISLEEKNAKIDNV